MEDRILQMFFEHDRWVYAIEKGCVKDVPKNWLYQLCKPEVRVAMYQAIANGTYEIAPPHTAKIPKEDGTDRIVYVSCNPASQARDLAILCEKYEITAVQPVDMFPHTQHVENVCALRRI